MNDGKKILAVILGAIFGFGAVAAITRNFSKEEEPEKEIEQEVPSNPNLDLFPLLATNIVTTDIDESEIAAYVEIPQGDGYMWGQNGLDLVSDGYVYNNMAFQLACWSSDLFAYTGFFDIHSYDIATSDFGTLDTRNSFVILSDGSSKIYLKDTYYIPITSNSLEILKSIYETNNAFSWTDDVYFSLSFNGRLCSAFCGSSTTLKEEMSGCFEFSLAEVEIKIIKA